MLLESTAFRRRYMNEETLLKMAREKGYSTAPLEARPHLHLDHTTRSARPDCIRSSRRRHGGKNGVPLSEK